MPATANTSCRESIRSVVNRLAEYFEYLRQYDIGGNSWQAPPPSSYTVFAVQTFYFLEKCGCMYTGSLPANM